MEAARQRWVQAGCGGVNKRTNRHKPRSLDAVDVVVVVIPSTYAPRMRISAHRRAGKAADSPPRALVAPRRPPSPRRAMKRVVGCALLLGTTSDALSLTTAVRHRHVCSSSSVAMGLFDGLKKVCHASLLPPRAVIAISSVSVTSSATPTGTTTTIRPSTTSRSSAPLRRRTSW